MGQQALNRKPNLSVRRRLQLDANTEIAEIGITVRKQMELTNNKSLTDVERGMHLMAAKILVNGQPIVYDDLMDGFTTEEMDKITEFLFPDAKKRGRKGHLKKRIRSYAGARVLIRQIPHADIVFLAHFTGGGIDGVLDLIVEDYFAYLDRAVEIYEKEITTPRRVVLSGIEKR